MRATASCRTQFDSRAHLRPAGGEAVPAPPSPPTTRRSSRARSTSSSPPPTPRAGRTARSRAARRASCASPAPTSWPSPTTTATACSRAWATCWSTPASACCSSTCTAGRAACASTAPPRCRATIRLLADTVGAQLIVRVEARAIFPNCPRYIPKLQLAEPSVYMPRPGRDPVEPAWKGFDRLQGRRAPAPADGSGRRGIVQYRKEWVERTPRFANPTTQLSIEGLKPKCLRRCGFGVRLCTSNATSGTGSRSARLRTHSTLTSLQSGFAVSGRGRHQFVAWFQSVRRRAHVGSLVFRAQTIRHITVMLEASGAAVARYGLESVNRFSIVRSEGIR